MARRGARLRRLALGRRRRWVPPRDGRARGRAARARASTGCCASGAGSASAGPSPYGRPVSETERFVFHEELDTAGLPMYGVEINEAIGWMLVRHGSDDAARASTCPRITRGDTWYAGGYSEPEAGSDLLALKTRAVRDGDRLPGQRLEAVDVERAPRRLRVRHRADRSRVDATPRAVDPPDRHDAARRRDRPGAGDGRMAREPVLLRRRRRARHQRRGGGRRGLGGAGRGARRRAGDELRRARGAAVAGPAARPLRGPRRRPGRGAPRGARAARDRPRGRAPARPAARGHRRAGRASRAPRRR